MIAIVCIGAPEKHMTTRLTPLHDGRWEVEVIQHICGWDTRLPQYDREVDLDGVLDILWEAENGGADELARALGLPEATIAAAWARNHATVRR